MAIFEERLRRLAEIHDRETLLVSLYLPLEKGEAGETKLPIRLKNLISQGWEDRERWSPKQARALEQDFSRVEAAALEERIGGSKSIALFASSALDLWESFRLPAKVEKRLTVDHTFHLSPLIALLEELERYCTALIDKGRARIFLLDLDGVEERLDIFGVVPGRHDQGGWAQARYQRHHDDRVMHHLKETANQLFNIFREEEFDRLFLGGTEELVSQFREHLHPYLRERLTGSFPLNLTSLPQEVQEETMAIVEQLRGEEARQLVERLRGEVHSGNLGVIGLEDTLHTWQAGQALTLLVNEGFSAPGRRCCQCGSLTIREGACPYCGAELEPLRDVVEELIRLAFLGNTEIKFIKGEEREALAEMGGIGALLRFAA